MPMPLRDQNPGFHHVTTRGNNKRRIFEDEVDRQSFSLQVMRVAKRYDWTVLAYCLMDNHYHLVVQIGEKGLARGMCELNTGHARTYNKRHGRINHLFGRRYWSRRIKTHQSILNTIRYVVRNPSAAGDPRPLEEQEWTSYASTIGLMLGRIAVAKDEVLAFFGNSSTRALEEFKAFCAAAMHAAPDRWQPP